MTDYTERKAATMEADILAGRSNKSLADAVTAFLNHVDIESTTFKKYARLLRFFSEYCERSGVEHIGQVTLELLDGYRNGRILNIRQLTWSKELQLLRGFLSFCVEREWIQSNPAKRMKGPRKPKPRERAPYTQEEIARIVAACDTFGRASYERLRARAMILLMRFYALRVSDVAVLTRDRIIGNEIVLQALKNGVPLRMPLYPEVKFALDCVPLTKDAAADCKYYFWTGVGSREGHIKTVGETLQAVYRESGVERAHNHRFRHTLATEILVKGGTIEDAANILGDDPATISKHYTKWSVSYQSRTVEIMGRVHGTSTIQQRKLLGSDLLQQVGWYRRWDLNPHMDRPWQILSLLRLPFRHSGISCNGFF